MPEKGMMRKRKVDGLCTSTRAVARVGISLVDRGGGRERGDLE